MCCVTFRQKLAVLWSTLTKKRFLLNVPYIVRYFDLNMQYENLEIFDQRCTWEASLGIYIKIIFYSTKSLTENSPKKMFMVINGLTIFFVLD